MATTPATTETTLQELAKRHLWMHFSRMGAYADGAEIPIIVRGDGCYVWDEHGNRYLDGLSALFCVNIGHGRADVAQAGADQAQGARLLHQLVLRAPARDRARRADRRPRARATSTACSSPAAAASAVETALKLVRQYHKLTGNPNKTKIIAREIAYHGTTLGALAATGITALRQPFEPFTPGGCHVPNTNLYRLPPGYGAENLAEAIARPHPVRGARDGRRGDHGAGPERRRLLHAARGLLPARPRDLRRATTSCSSPTRSSARGAASGSGSAPQRYGYQPDIITTAKGLTAAYAPMGAVIASDRVFEPFPEGTNSFTHGFTFGGHPMCAAVAMANLDVFEHEGCSSTCARTRAHFRAMLESLRDIPIVGDVRGAGYFHAIELVKDRDTKAVLQPRGVRDAAARLPLRRAVPPRADLPRRRPRRPGHPALAAADRRARAVRGDRGGPAPGARGGVASGCCALSDADASASSSRDLDVARPRGRGRPRRPGPLGAHLRAGGPDAVALGRRAAAHHGHGARHRRSASATFIAWLADHGLAGARLRHRLRHETVPKALVEAAASADFPLFEVPYECRSSRSPSRRSRGWSTSSTRCCSARSPPRSACSGSSSPSAGSTRSPARWPSSSAAPRSSSTAAASCRRCAPSAATLDEDVVARARRRAARARAPRRRARLRARPPRARLARRSRCPSPAATARSAAAFRRPGSSRSRTRAAWRSSTA